MAARLTGAVAALAVALACAPAASAQYPAGPFAAWDGTNPFNCTLQDAGTGTTVPDPDADPFCIEFDKNSQNLSEFGILDFLSKEPARVAMAAPKCFYFQSDHWTGSAVQGMPPELWHWDGQYFFDKARGVGGVNVQNFRVGGQPASPSDYGEVPTAFAPYMDQGGGGSFVTGDFDAEPQCAALVDTQAERDAIYSGGTPPPLPPSTKSRGPCAGQNTINGSPSADELIGGAYGDRLFGFAGRDLLVGAGGRDCLWGQRGNDRLRGGRSRDKLRGGRGNDRLNGGPARDLIYGGPGDDVIFAGDGKRDRIRCGPGFDFVSTDAVPERLSGCESIAVAQP